MATGTVEFIADRGILKPVPVIFRFAGAQASKR